MKSSHAAVELSLKDQFIHKIPQSESWKAAKITFIVAFYAFEISILHEKREQRRLGGTEIAVVMSFKTSQKRDFCVEDYGESFVLVEIKLESAGKTINMYK